MCQDSELNWLAAYLTCLLTGGGGDGPASLVVRDLQERARGHGSRGGPSAAHSVWGSNLGFLSLVCVVVVFKMVVQQLGFPEGLGATGNFTLELVVVQIDALVQRCRVIRALGAHD